jgi:prolyl-tRNA editing enzyme YbaK/EbsC (Cys-tRNA(Pro) deacylase)
MCKDVNSLVHAAARVSSLSGCKTRSIYLKALLPQCEQYQTVCMMLEGEKRVSRKKFNKPFEKGPLR